MVGSRAWCCRSFNLKTVLTGGLSESATYVPGRPASTAVLETREKATGIKTAKTHSIGIISAGL
jgi:hypothetical protein